MLQFLQQYDATVARRVPTLRKSVIHGDGNDYNVIVGTAKEHGPPVIGMIDFGDLVYSSTVNELAIALAYIMLDKADPVAAAAVVVGAYHARFALEADELEILFPLACMRLCVSAVLATCQQAQQPDNAYLSISEAPAWRLLPRLTSVPPRAAAEAFRQACGLPATSAPVATRPREAILAARQKHLGASLSLSYDEPLYLVRGSMQYLFDEQGRALLDGVNNVCHVGHCHPRVVAAARQQIGLLNTNTRYLHENIVDYAERLTATFPEPLEVCFFVNSGSEANDLALRLARAYTRRREVVIVDGAYHGHLSSLIEISPYKFDGPGGQGAPPHVHKVAMPDVYRGPYGSDDKNAGQKYALLVAQAIQDCDGGIAAFFCESLLSCGGQIVLPPGYLAHAYRHVADAGGVCVADEVQVGFGRVGSHFWGFETQGVVPDIVTLGKPMGNGHPLAAVITRRAIADALADGMEYFNTFGGNPVSCAVGLAVLDVLREERLQDAARDVGGYLKAGLEKLKDRYPLIGDVRGAGLFLGVELVADGARREPAADVAHRVVQEMKARRILLSTDGPLHNVIKIKPPLAFSKANADYLLASLESVMSGL